MNRLLLSAKLFIFGAFCDSCASLCTYMAEKCIIQNKPLNKKLLTSMSNFSNNSLLLWQAFERKLLKSIKDPGKLP